MEWLGRLTASANDPNLSQKFFDMNALISDCKDMEHCMARRFTSSINVLSWSFSCCASLHRHRVENDHMAVRETRTESLFLNKTLSQSNPYIASSNVIEQSFAIVENHSLTSFFRITSQTWADLIVDVWQNSVLVRFHRWDETFLDESPYYFALLVT